MRLGIVGGGTAAGCLVMALARALGSQSVDLVIIEPRDFLWRGRAYQKDRDEILVNGPLTIMTLDPRDPEHALRWFARHYDRRYAPGRWAGDAFPPRHVYGSYLEATLAATLAGLTASNWSFTWIRDRVKQVIPDRDAALVCSEGGRRIRCDYVVLCVGEPTDYDPYQLGGHPAHIPQAYPVAATLADIDSAASVAVIGTGLAANDVVLGLHTQGHRGPIRLFSRRGLLAAIRRPPSPVQAHVLTRHAILGHLDSSVDHPGVRLDAIARLALAEALEAGATPEQIAAEVAPIDWGVERLRRQWEDRNRASPIDWLQVASWALITTVHEWWPRLRTVDRRWFYRHYHHVWSSFMSPMPVATAQTLMQLADTGQLEVIRGLNTVSPTGSGIQLITDQGATHADVVIAAATAAPSAQHTIPAEAWSLISGLVRSGHAQFHPDGGLRVHHPSGRLLDRAARPSSSIFALGHLTSGTHYYLSGIPMLVWRSEAISTSLREDLTIPDATDAADRGPCDARGR